MKDVYYNVPFGDVARGEEKKVIEVWFCECGGEMYHDKHSGTYRLFNKSKVMYQHICDSCGKECYYEVAFPNKKTIVSLPA